MARHFTLTGAALLMALLANARDNNDRDSLERVLQLIDDIGDDSGPAGDDDAKVVLVTGELEDELKA